jgi:K+-sensing histidine kinase KdpD
MLAHLATPHTDPEGTRTADGLSMLDEILAQLGRAVTSAQVGKILVEGGMFTAGATDGALVLLSDDRTELRVVHIVGGVTGTAPTDGSLPLTARSPLAEVVRSRSELWLNNPDQLAERYPELIPTSDCVAWAALPLSIDKVLLGAVGWSFKRPWFTAEQRTSLRALASAGGVALYRAGLFDSERLARMRAEVALDEAVRRDQLMAQVSSTLDTLTDIANPTPALTTIARLTLPLLGDWCAITVVDQDGRLRQMVSAHMDETRGRLLQDTGRRSGTAGRKLPSGLNKGRPVTVQSIGDHSTSTTGLEPHQVRLLRRAGLKRLLVVPMRVHGQTLGTFCCASADASAKYSAADLALADRVARRCAAVIENAQLRATAERARYEREDVVAATSHELRTPLSHIKGFVSTLRTTDTTWDAETRDDFLAEIEQEADRLARLVETLIDMARIDAGGLEPTSWGFSTPATLVEAGIDRVRASLGERRLEIHVPDDVPPVWVDASQIERVIANLVENAAKYSPANEPIGVRVKLADKSVMFRIEDRGLGIPPGHLERVFEPFFREPKGEYPAKPGTGLGLAICRSMIRAQNGRVWAEARPGGGTVFVFTLPIRANGAKRAQPTFAC